MKHKKKYGNRPASKGKIQAPKNRNKWADHYTRKAQKDKYPARSVYKLQEMQQKFHLIKKGNRVLDLGCAPGSWLLYAVELIGKSGQVTGIDLKALKIPIPSQATVHIGNILEMDSATFGKGYNVVMSDMAPSTTGYKDVDAVRSLELCRAALNIAGEFLAPGGSFICKIFQGEGLKEFTDDVAKFFKKHKVFKPQSCRKASREIYIIGIDKKQEG